MGVIVGVKNHLACDICSAAKALNPYIQIIRRYLSALIPDSSEQSI